MEDSTTHSTFRFHPIEIVVSVAISCGINFEALLGMNKRRNKKSISFRISGLIYSYMEMILGRIMLGIDKIINCK